MKYSGMLVFLVLLLCASCSEEIDPADMGKGILQVQGSKFVLTGGAIQQYVKPGMEGDTVYYFELYSAGIDSVSGQGTGHMVAMDVSPLAGGQGIDGTYKNASEEGSDGIFDGLIYLDYNTSTGNYYSVYILTSGTLVISEEDGIYDLNMDLRADEYIMPADSANYDLVLSCRYEGTLVKKEFKK